MTTPAARSTAFLAAFPLVVLGSTSGCYPDSDELYPAEEEDAGAGSDGPARDAPTLPDGPQGVGDRATGEPARFDVLPDVAGDATASRCVQYGEVFCARLSACNPTSLARTYTSDAQCRARNQTFCEIFGTLPGATWPSTACIAGYRSVTCANFFNDDQPPECVSPGTFADGAPCWDETQCQGRRCVFPMGSRCGTCAKRSNAGEPCSSGLHCQYGLHCSDAGRCQRPGLVGAACDANRPCQPTLTCRAGLCAERGRAGAPCTDGDACDFYSGYGCNTTMMRCVLVVVSPTSCRTNTDGTFQVCAANGTCDATRTCVPAATDGNACAATGPNCFFPASCQGGKCGLPVPDPTCAPPVATSTNNSAEIMGPTIGMDTLSASAIRKTVKVNLMAALPAGLEVTTAHTFGPGKGIFYVIGFVNRGVVAGLPCEIRSGMVTLRDGAGQVVLVDSPGVFTGSVGMVNTRWVESCLASGESGYLLGVKPSTDVDLYARTEQIDFAIVSTSVGTPVAARVVPTSYSASSSSLSVTIRNDGAARVKVGAFSRFVLFDAQGPIQWGFLGQPANDVLESGQTAAIAGALFFLGKSDRVRAFVDLEPP